MSKTVKHILGLFLALLLILGMLFGLRACGSKINLPNFGEQREAMSADVKNVNDLIASIPATLTQNDFDLVRNARTAFDALNENDKKLVTDLDKLVNAEDAMKSIEDGIAKLDAFGNLLNSLDGLEGQALIDRVFEIRNAYDGLTDEQKAQVDLSKLLEVEAQLESNGDYLNALLKKIELPRDLDLFNELKLKIDALSEEERAKIDNELLDRLNASLEPVEEVKEEEHQVEEKSEAVKNVEDMISVIKTPITLDSADEVNKVSDAFNALSDAEKKEVSNYDKLRTYLDDLSSLQDEAKKNEAAQQVEESTQNKIPNTGVE